MDAVKQARDDYIVSSRLEGCEIAELAVVTELTPAAVRKVLEKRGVTTEIVKNIQNTLKST